MNMNLLKFLDARLGPAVCGIFSKPQRTPAEHRPETADGRFLFIRPGGMGDMIMLLPTLRRIHETYPERKIDILCERRNAEILHLAGLPAEGLLYDVHPLRTLARLLKRRYTMVFDTEQFHHFSAVMAAVSGAPTRVGFMVSPKRNGIYTHLKDYQLDGREDLQFARLLEPLGIRGTMPELPGMLRGKPLATLPAEADRDVAGPVLVIHPGGTVQAKRLPVNRLAEISRGARRRLGLSIALVGGKSDRASAKTFARLADFPFADYCGRLSLAQTAEICRRASVFLGPDSGLSHLAVAVGAPCVTIFGPSDPRKWSVPNPGQRILRISLACSPCSIFGYLKPCNSFDCIRRIRSEPVLDAMESVFRRHATAEAPTQGKENRPPA